MNKDKEIMFFNNTHFSDQQYAIIGEACQPVQNGKEGKVVRVNAAAGSGKTTTLEALAWNLIHNHEHPGVIYYVLAKSVKTEATSHRHQTDSLSNPIRICTAL